MFIHNYLYAYLLYRLYDYLTDQPYACLFSDCLCVYLPVFMPSCLLDYLHSYLPVSIPASNHLFVYLSLSLPVLQRFCPDIYLPDSLYAHRPVCLPACLRPTRLYVFMPYCLHVCMPLSVTASLFQCLHSLLSLCLPSWLSSYLPACLYANLFFMPSSLPPNAMSLCQTCFLLYYLHSSMHVRLSSYLPACIYVHPHSCMPISVCLAAYTAIFLLAFMHVCLHYKECINAFILLFNPE